MKTLQNTSNLQALHPFVLFFFVSVQGAGGPVSIKFLKCASLLINTVTEGEGRSCCVYLCVLKNASPYLLPFERVLNEFSCHQTGDHLCHRPGSWKAAGMM